VKSLGDLRRMIFNDYLDAAVAAFFLIAALVVLADSVRLWIGVLQGRRVESSTEVPFQPRALSAGD
jgi:carbon starvation protein